MTAWTPTRSVESLVEGHRKATERRRAGKPIWDRTLRIKDLFTESNDPETAIEVGKKIAERIEKSSWLNPDTDGEDPYVRELIDGLLDQVEDTDSLNRMLDELYDLADEDRVHVL